MAEPSIDVRDPRPFSSVRTLTVTGPQDVPLPEIIEALREAMDGGPPLMPVPDGEPGTDVVAAARGIGEPLARDTVLLLPTSGSTGKPKVVELSKDALMSGARATHKRVGSAGRWLLALPLTHIAGWQVLVRGLLADPADQLPAALDSSLPFSPETFCTADLDGVRYTSLVPTQLSRLLKHKDSAHALARLDAVLIGGAATSPMLRQQALTSNVRIVRTYGMTETCGGCIYDGVPLDDVRVGLTREGLLRISGPVLASRYRGDPATSEESFITEPGDPPRRWFVTADQASVDSDDTVTIRGRADDTIITGGENVSPASVEAVLLSMSRIREAIVVGVPDTEWGQQVVAVVSLEPPDLPSADVPVLATGLVEQRLGRHCAPRAFVIVDEVPLLGIGKPDRKAAYRLAMGNLR